MKIGEFKYENGLVSGPKNYMHDRGNEKLDRIMAGSDTAFNVMLECSPSSDVVATVLVALQTDYAGWLGMFRFNERRKFLNLK